MKSYIQLSLFVFPLFISACSSFHITREAVQPAAHIKTIHLNKDIQQLLQQEMQAIEQGVTALIPAIARGEWDQIAKIGRHIEQSYLLKQKLTPEQRHSLHKSLPARFIQLDQAFHESAGMLAHGAEMKNPDIVNFYVYKLSSACVECHTEFAAEKFPRLVREQAKAHSHH
ncbi:hypothetical protein [methanotrophic endosymbiont of Bathymodiolus puteoserpentis (Logatchev)]|jgi:hypothetical protein|uniref:hypothetical protein n=1 Tax=methanotrophic endosymbiont of Bathymodiolus puteoserpentis (Logatchev) TaxID=343235 RepID=UPI0013CB36E6|nr:hypothetical protein [methanotrophic endosymbiont of Bathymodiolus puteoserpentis (Logatchev)]SHE23039.1 hypothetical protein BPUTEOMOX_2426 [methanotrophic endosymbiont of Bathymodiolus puteoserpentis (Logatchev)]